MPINTDYPWNSPTCIELTSKYSDTYTCHTESEVHDNNYRLGKQAQGCSYSGCDKLSWLQILFVYINPAIPPSSFNLFFILVTVLF